MTEFSRISIREAQEHATAALRACELLINRARVLGASTVETELDAAAMDLAGALKHIDAADKYLQQKAGLLPGTTSGHTPGK